MRVELEGADGGAIVDLGGTDASLPHFLLLGCVLSDDFAGAPQSNCAVFHASSDDALFIELVNPVERGETGGAEGVADERCRRLY